MKIETFFEKFDRFVDAPDFVTKMRELVLWSAFSGAFSREERTQAMPHDWAVEGAPTLSAIPASWRWQRGGDEFQVIRGVSYRKNDARDSPKEGSFPVLRANNIGIGVTFDDLIYVPRDNIRDEQFVRRGDILIAMSSGSKRLVGKAAPIVTDFQGAFGAFCGVIRNKSDIHDEFLARYFKSPQYTSWVTAAGRGIGINNLGRGDLDSLPVPKPPLAEQVRIVAKIDELMALCDRLEAQQQEREARHAGLARAALGRFARGGTSGDLDHLFHSSFAIAPADLRKSILSMAIQGRLVPHESSDESGQDLLLQITEEKRALIASGDIKRHMSGPFDACAADLVKVPSSWATPTLGEIALKISDGTHKTPSYVEHGIPFVSVKDFSGGMLDFSHTRFITAAEHRELFKRCDPRQGDILLGRIGTLGKAVIVDVDTEFSLFVSVGLVRCSQRFVEPAYLKMVLNSPLSAEQFDLIKIGGATHTNKLNLGDLHTLVIPLPSFLEQRRIVARVDHLMSLVDQLESHLTASRSTATNLLNALVAELTART